MKNFAENILRYEYEYQLKKHKEYVIAKLNEVGFYLNELMKSNLSNDIKITILRMSKKQFYQEVEWSSIKEEDRKAFDFLKNAINAKIKNKFRTIAKPNQQF